MFATVIKGSKQTTLPCTHAQSTSYPEGYPESNSGPIDRITVELVGVNPSLLGTTQSNTFTIPDDADVIYLLNEGGKTIGTFSLEVANRNQTAADGAASGVEHTFKVAK